MTKPNLDGNLSPPATAALSAGVNAYIEARMRAYEHGMPSPALAPPALTPADAAALRQAGAAAATKRAQAVLASEHFAGREKVAARLLASDMTAEAVCDLLSEMPAGDGNDPSPARRRCVN